MPAGKPAYIWSGTEWIPIGLQIGAKYQPGSPSASVSSTGDLWIDSDNNNLYVWTGTGWSLVTAQNTVTIDAFQLNAKSVTTNYTLNSQYNAISAGPITINSGVVVEIPSGSSWVIV